VQIAPQHGSVAQLLDAASRMEDLGVDLVMGWDHFFPLTEPDRPGDHDGAHVEAFTLLAAMAERTHRVEFGPLVAATPFRNPDLLADMARTIDHISARSTGDGTAGTGRFVLGLGAGWNARDFDEYRYRVGGTGAVGLGTVGERLTAFEAAVPRVIARIQRLSPPPTRRIPILIGGAGQRRTLRVVAEHADLWHAFGDEESLAHTSRVLDAHCAAIGRDPFEIERSTGTSVRGLGVGDPETAERFIAMGFSTFIVAISPPDLDDSPVRALLRWRDARA
jgi:probable F420-dependent oxidoreductase